jgi:adenylate kinase family enzyme
MKHLTIAEFGPPAIGKGTTGKMLRDRVRREHDAQLVHYLATGDLVRHAEKQDNPLARRVSEKLRNGMLADDDDILALLIHQLGVDERTNNYAPGCQYLLLDGSPRTPVQASAMANFLEYRLVFHFVNAPDEVLFERWKKRVSESEVVRTDNASENLFRRRQIEYRELTFPTLAHLREQGVNVVEIDAMPDPENVVSQMYAHVKRLFDRDRSMETRRRSSV